MKTFKLRSSGKILKNVFEWFSSSYWSIWFSMFLQRSFFWWTWNFHQSAERIRATFRFYVHNSADPRYFSTRDDNLWFYRSAGDDRILSSKNAWLRNKTFLFSRVIKRTWLLISDFINVFPGCRNGSVICWGNPHFLPLCWFRRLFSWH